MARRAEGLKLRGTIWWMRVRVPTDVRTAFGKGEVHQSLGTGEYAAAKERARYERIKLDGEWRRLRRIANPSVDSELDEMESHRLVTKWFVAEERKHQLSFLDNEALEEAEIDLLWMMDWDQVGGSVTQAVEELLASEGIKLDQQSLSLRSLERRIQAAMIESQKRLLQRHHGGHGFPLDPQFAQMTATTKVAPVAKIALADLIDKYRNDPTRQSVSSKTRRKADAQFVVFKEVFGASTPVLDISRLDARKLMDLLKRLPDNVAKRLPGLPLDQAAAVAEERGLRPMAIATANNYLTALSSLFRYAVAEQIIPSSPAERLRINGDTIRAKDKRLPFSVADLQRIFSAPLYTGCTDDASGYATPGPNQPRRGRFWVPLIALFSGMRLNEICQLTLDDIAEEDGVNVILVRGDDDDAKRIKTTAGERFVPIHPELKRIGLLRYVTEQRNGGNLKARLFPELSIASTGYVSDNFSKWFARFLDKIGVCDKRKVFHSFRHSYRDALREADISSEKVRALGGWSSGRTEDDYGKGLRPKTLASDIEAVKYDGLDLSHLFRPV